MTKRLLISLAVISIALAGVVGATVAYFSAGQVLGGNTFATGKVSLDGTYNLPLHVSKLVPGETQKFVNVAVNYNGNIPADIYIGARGTSVPGDPAFLADKLWLTIYKTGTSDVVYDGWVSGLSTSWRLIATGITEGQWAGYDLAFTLDTSTGNLHMDITNYDTELLIYAVQTGGPVPGTVPYLTTGTSWFNL